MPTIDVLYFTIIMFTLSCTTGVPALIERGFNRSEYVSELRRWSYQLMPEFKDAAFEAVDFEYTNWPKRDDLEANRKTFVDVRLI